MKNPRIPFRKKLQKSGLAISLSALFLTGLCAVLGMLYIRRAPDRAFRTIVIFTGLLLFLGILVVVSTRLIALWFSNAISHLRNDVEMIRNGVLVHRADVIGNDDISDLANDINAIADAMQLYTDILTEKERLDTELEVATKIQADMLPVVEVLFPRGHRDFELYADMEPAKEVGGDFYDFFLIDGDHLALVMADVAGKGIPAALLMVTAKTLIKSLLLKGGRLAQICGTANNLLVEQTKDELFVTAWIGILELSTGMLTAVNAGHEYPLLKRAGMRYEQIKTDHCPPLGSISDIVYTEHSRSLHFGDRLFLYTDGLIEAKKDDGDNFGNERLLSLLNENPITTPQALLKLVRNAVKDFVGDRPQYDDITMLSLHYTRR